MYVCALNLFMHIWICLHIFESIVLLGYFHCSTFKSTGLCFNHLDSGLTYLCIENYILDLFLTTFVVHNWLFARQFRITRVDWLNQEFSFSTWRTFYICEKILKVQFTHPLELGLNLILQTGGRNRASLQSEYQLRLHHQVRTREQT